MPPVLMRSLYRMTRLSRCAVLDTTLPAMRANTDHVSKTRQKPNEREGLEPTTSLPIKGALPTTLTLSLCADRTGLEPATFPPTGDALPTTLTVRFRCHLPGLRPHTSSPSCEGSPPHGLPDKPLARHCRARRPVVSGPSLQDPCGSRSTIPVSGLYVCLGK